MDPFRRAHGADDEQASWRSSVTPIPDDMIDPELLGLGASDLDGSGQTNNTTQQSLYQQQHTPQQPIQPEIQNNSVDQSSANQHSPPPEELQYLDLFDHIPFNLLQQFNHRPDAHLSPHTHDGSVHQHRQVDLQQSNPASSSHANPHAANPQVASPQVDPHFHTQAYFQLDPQPSAQGYAPTPPRDGPPAHQVQPFDPLALPYSPPSTPQDAITFFEGPVAKSASLPAHPAVVPQGNAPTTSLPGAPHIQHDSSAVDTARPAQQPAKNRPQSFSRGFGQGPMVDDNMPFTFQTEVDSSPPPPVAAMPATPTSTRAQALRQDDTAMAMDLDDWDSGRALEVGLPSSSPPGNNINGNENMEATPSSTHVERREEQQEQERNNERPRTYGYNRDAHLTEMNSAPVANMEISQTLAGGPGASRAVSIGNINSASLDPSHQQMGSHANPIPIDFGLGIGNARRGEIRQRIPTLRQGVSFLSGVPYPQRYPIYNRTAEAPVQPRSPGPTMNPPEIVVNDDDQALTTNGRPQTVNVSGPQVGESSRHGQYLVAEEPVLPLSMSGALQAQESAHSSMPSHESYTEGVMQHMRAPAASQSESVSVLLGDPQPAASDNELANLVRTRILEETPVGEVMAAGIALGHDLAQSQQQPPMEVEDGQLSGQNQQAQDPSERNVQGNNQDANQATAQDQRQDSTESKPTAPKPPPTFTNISQFKPTKQRAPPIQHPLLISPARCASPEPSPPPSSPSSTTPLAASASAHATISSLTSPPTTSSLSTTCTHAPIPLTQSEIPSTAPSSSKRATSPSSASYTRGPSSSCAVFPRAQRATWKDNSTGARTSTPTRR